MRWQTRFLEWALGEFLDRRTAADPVAAPAIVVSEPSIRHPKKGPCHTCFFWHKTTDKLGLCRALPPTDADRSLVNKPRGKWMLTADTDWCGVYEPGH